MKSFKSKTAQVAPLAPAQPAQPHMPQTQVPTQQANISLSALLQTYPALKQYVDWLKLVPSIQKRFAAELNKLGIDYTKDPEMIELIGNDYGGAHF